MWIGVYGKAPKETLTDPAKIKRALSRYPRRYGMGNPDLGPRVEENYPLESEGGYTGLVAAGCVGREHNVLYVHTRPQEGEIYFQVDSADPNVEFSRIFDAFVRNFKITDTIYSVAEACMLGEEKAA